MNGFEALDLASATSPSLPPLPTVLVPLGSIEQHGPHLPLDTDTVIATAVATRAAEMLAQTDVQSWSPRRSATAPAGSTRIRRNQLDR